jgi:hypothetical protein
MVVVTYVAGGFPEQCLPHIVVVTVQVSTIVLVLQ